MPIYPVDFKQAHRLIQSDITEAQDFISQAPIVLSFTAAGVGPQGVTMQHGLKRVPQGLMTLGGVTIISPTVDEMAHWTTDSITFTYTNATPSNSYWVQIW